MHLKHAFEVVELEGSWIAVPIVSVNNELSGVIKLNETAALLFGLIQKGAEEDTLVDALTDSYEIGRSKAAFDVHEFLDLLRLNSLLVE